MASLKEKKVKENKFDSIVTELDKKENEAKVKADTVIKAITGQGTGTKIITDRNGRTREIKISEKRKTMPVYIPESLYEKFDAITTAYGKSNNSAIVELIRDYVISKKGVLEQL